MLCKCFDDAGVCVGGVCGCVCVYVRVCGSDEWDIRVGPCCVRVQYVRWACVRVCVFSVCVRA